MKPLDFVIILLSVFIVILFSINTIKKPIENPLFYIEHNGEKQLYPVNEDKTIKISGDLGDTIIEITNSKARITSSPCKDQLCTQMGYVNTPGSVNACLPNRVILGIQGNNSGEIDVFTY